jgi:phage protein D
VAEGADALPDPFRLSRAKARGQDAGQHFRQLLCAESAEGFGEHQFGCRWADEQRTVCALDRFWLGFSEWERHFTASIAKGFDATGAAKGQQRRHWDDKTVKTILQDAAKDAGIEAVSVDPALAAKVIDYFSMMDESFLAMGRRLAKEVGGHFRVEGEKAVMSKRGASYAPVVTASWGGNLHTWDIRPTSSRDLYGKVKAPWYDKKAAKWEAVEVETGLESTAVLTLRETSATKEEAQRRADARAETVKQSAGEGSVTIEGDTGAVPDGLCLVTGTRPGIDGTYRIASVSHSYSRSGFMTDIQLSQPQGGAGKDSR